MTILTPEGGHLYQKRILTMALAGLGALVWFFAAQPGFVRADSEVPSSPLFEGGVWSTGTVVVVCVVAVIAVILGIALVRRARAKRRASERGGGL